MSVSSPDPKFSFCESLTEVTNPELCPKSDFLNLKKLGKGKFLRRARIPESEMHSIEPVEVLIEDRDNEFLVDLMCSAASRSDMKAWLGNGVPKVSSCISVTEDVNIAALVSCIPWPTVAGCSLCLRLAD